MKATRCQWCCLGLALLIGCSGGGDEWTEKLPETVPASGVVLLDGQPVEGASIVFSPEPPGEHAASALSGPDGEFELNAFPSKVGAVPGSYQVGISKTVRGAPVEQPDPESFGEDAQHAAEAPAPTLWHNALPAQYANPVSSGLKQQVPKEGTSSLRIELKSK